MNVLRAFPDICSRFEAHPAPLLRYQYLRQIVGMSANDPILRKLQDQGMHTEPLRSILSRRKARGWWYADSPAGVYKKYQGWVWSLLFAAELGAPADEPHLIESCVYFMDRCFSTKNGAFESAARPSMTIACFVAHACYFLTYFGFGKDDRVEAAFRWLAGNTGTDGGMRCFVMDTCLSETCTMAIPKFLKAASLLSPARRKGLLGDSVEKAVQRLMDVDIDRYQPVEATEWARRIRGKSIDEIRRWKTEFQGSGEFKRKQSWMRFQFPLHYDSDLLEALIMPGRLRVKTNPTLKSAAARILAAGSPSGWTAGRSLKGKLWADLPCEDDWITLRALEALSYYG